MEYHAFVIYHATGHYRLEYEHCRTGMVRCHLRQQHQLTSRRTAFSHCHRAHHHRHQAVCNVTTGTIAVTTAHHLLSYGHLLLPIHNNRCRLLQNGSRQNSGQAEGESHTLIPGHRNAQLHHNANNALLIGRTVLVVYVRSTRLPNNQAHHTEHQVMHRH